MKKEKTKSFRNSIRNALFFYALVAVAAIIAAFAILFAVMVFFLIPRQSEREHRQLGIVIEETIGQARNRLMELKDDTVLAEEMAAQSLSAKTCEKLYSIVSAGEMHGDFYLLDRELQCFSGSMKVSPEYFYDRLSGSRFIREMPENQRKVCARWEKDGKDGQPSYELAVQVDRGEELAGYLLIEYGQNGFLEAAGKNGTDAAAANSVGRVYWDTGIRLVDERRRILDEVRFDRGFSVVKGRFIYICFTCLDDGELVLYTIRDFTELVRIFAAVGGVAVFAFVCLLLLDAYASLVVAEKKTQIIDQISKSMQQGNWDSLHMPALIDSEDEFGQIARAYNHLEEEIKRLLVNNREITRLQMLAEVRRLESQFNPHFIFNTLETIRVLVVIDPQGAQQAINRLAELLRYSIDGSFDRVRLAEDMHYTECYLYIQKLRLQKKLEYRIECEPGIEGAMIQRLIIQPLVENAIKYGKDENGFCSVEICLGREGNRLWIQVMDQGLTMPEEEMSELRNLLMQEQNTSGHLGLYQLHRRMRLTYGDEYGLTFWKREEGGMCFRLELPYEMG